MGGGCGWLARSVLESVTSQRTGKPVVRGHVRITYPYILCLIDPLVPGWINEQQSLVCQGRRWVVRGSEPCLMADRFRINARSSNLRWAESSCFPPFFFSMSPDTTLWSTRTGLNLLLVLEQGLWVDVPPRDFTKPCVGVTRRRNLETRLFCENGTFQFSLLLLSSLAFRSQHPRAEVGYKRWSILST